MPRISIALLLIASTPLSTAVAQLRGDSAAVAMARTMIARMGDTRVWAGARTMHVIEEVHRPDVRLPYRSETWRSLDAPRIWVRSRSAEIDRTLARSPTEGWELRDSVLRRATEMERRRWLGYWPRNIYVMYHRLAREDSLLWLVKMQERRFAVLDARSGERLCDFDVTLGGDVLRWSASFGLDTEEWIYGPLVAFGPIRMPA